MALKKALAFSTTEENMERCKEIAKTLEYKSVSEFIEDSVNIMADTDTAFIKTISNFAKGLKLPLGKVIQNICADYFARLDAEREIDYELNGAYPPKILEQFVHDKDGLITGTKLYKMLKEQYKKAIKK